MKYTILYFNLLSPYSYLMKLNTKLKKNVMVKPWIMSKILPCLK